MFTAAVLLCLARLAPGQWTTNNGTRVSFVFVQPSEKKVWRPSGDSIDYASLPRPTNAVWTGKETEPILVAVTKPAAGLDGIPAVRFKLPASTELNASFLSATNISGIWMSGYKPVESQPSEQDVAIGIADGAWNVVNWIEFRKTGNGLHAVKQHGTPIRLSVRGTSRAHTAGPFTMLEVPTLHGFENVSLRFVVKTRNGGTMPFTGSNPSSNVQGLTNYVFQGDVQTVDRVELESRSFEWHTIRVAHFKAN